MKDIQISKVLAHALRHDPKLYGLSPDEEGWVELEDILAALRRKGRRWETLEIEDIKRVTKNNDKKRYEIAGKRIRAFYGHSLERKIIKQAAEPPDILYHGTSPNFIENIRRKGLLPMKRQYAHLSVDRQTAKQVGGRRSAEPVILIIDAKRAFLSGIVFYKGNDLIWLADGIPPEYIDCGE